jgi:serine/threonine protein kinase
MNSDKKRKRQNWVRWESRSQRQSPQDASKTSESKPVPSVRRSASSAVVMVKQLGESKFSQSQDVIGLSLGNIKITRLLGVGGMGKVYQAEHIQLQTQYAVKVLHPDLSSDTLIVERFRREAMMSSSLRHPGIVFITDFGFHEQLGLYITMEYLDGRSLNYLIAEHPSGMRLQDVCGIVYQICDALAHAHERGVIHRDLKPENIFILNQLNSSHSVKVLDFGIARLMQGQEPHLTLDGHIMGTPVYVAPEQATGKEINERTDIYALGIVFYEMLVGNPPFHSLTPIEILTQHINERVPPLSKARPELVGTQLEALVATMLSKCPEQRPLSMSELQRQLSQAVGELQQKELFASIGNLANPTIQILSASQDSLDLAAAMQELTAMPHILVISDLYRALPSLSSLPLPLFWAASWSSLLWDLTGNKAHSDSFTLALSFVRWLLDFSLEYERDLELMEFIGIAIQRAFEDLFMVCDEDRQRHIVDGLQSQFAHPLFPTQVLPAWVSTQSHDKWQKIRNVFTSDVRALFRNRSDNSEPQTTQSEQPDSLTPTPAENTALQPIELPTESRNNSLFDKLKREVSFANLRAVLNHEIHLFGKKKK